MTSIEGEPGLLSIAEKHDYNIESITQSYNSWCSIYGHDFNEIWENTSGRKVFEILDASDARQSAKKILLKFDYNLNHLDAYANWEETCTYSVELAFKIQIKEVNSLFEKCNNYLPLVLCKVELQINPDLYESVKFMGLISGLERYAFQDF